MRRINGPVQWCSEHFLKYKHQTPSRCHPAWQMQSMRSAFANLTAVTGIYPPSCYIFRFFFSIWALPQCRLLQICSLNRMGPGEKTGERYPYFTNCQEAQELAPVALRELMLLQVHDVVKGTPQPILPLGVYSISSMRYSKLYCKWTLQWKTSLSCKRG